MSDDFRNRFALYWLPPMPDDWAQRVKSLEGQPSVDQAWHEVQSLASVRLDFVRTGRLDAAARRRLGERPPSECGAALLKLAILGSATTAHLHPAIRMAAVRRGLWLEIHEVGYGQYWQALNEPDDALVAFAPDAILLALDAHHLARGADASLAGTDAEAAYAAMRDLVGDCCRMARERFGCPVLLQTPLPVHVPLLGSNEQSLPGSPARQIARLNAELRQVADVTGATLLALDAEIAVEGMQRWHDPVLWHRAKQEISPVAAPCYGELVARLLVAVKGASRKCLVLDLDNTLWGGVVGDDGLDGLVLGQGSAEGEAFASFQAHALQLSKRGVILAVCSKNDESVALEAFDRHPEMILRREDIACFVANWNDKAANLRTIAASLDIGLDALVFVDDNPFERNLVREALPAVAVPEVPDEPAMFAACLADAGYFESVAVTVEDRERTRHYRANAARTAFQSRSTDLASYLANLDMRLIARRFDTAGLKRITQLINKTNQFNLTTRRMSEEEVAAVMADPGAFGLQMRLLDRFGDNGIISIVIGRLGDGGDVAIDTWLMSCRVLGRTVEESVLDLVVAHARRLGGGRLVGRYRPTAKNGMVREHYRRLGFSAAGEDADGSTLWYLPLAGYAAGERKIETIEE